jgi:hypothetical protein
VRSYLRIRNFSAHQYLDHPSFRHPLPDGKVPSSTNTLRVLRTKRKEKNRREERARATPRAPKPEDRQPEQTPEQAELAPFPWPKILAAVQHGGRVTGYATINDASRQVLTNAGIRWAELCDARDRDLNALRSRYESARRSHVTP